MLLVLADSQRDAAALPFDQELDHPAALLDLADAGDRPDRVEHLGSHFVEVLALGDGEDQAVLALGRRLDGAQGGRATGADRHRHTGEENRFAKRQDGQGEDLGHWLEPF